MAGISGTASGLVSHVFRLLEVVKPSWLVLENVRNMLVLDRGHAMEYLVGELADLGYRWAYRLVDSRAVGVPQRRQRVILVASRTEDPRAVLFSDEAGDPGEGHYRDDAFGFYWTEGLTGLGWARDAIPTLKGGSTLGIPSPPAVWIPGALPGYKIVTPLIEDAEAFQGFPRGWTEAASSAGRRGTSRWKLTGNAVTVGISQWLGRRLVSPGRGAKGVDSSLENRRTWPIAAWGDRSGSWARSVSMWPVRKPYAHLLDTLSHHDAKPLSLRASSGFLSRTERSRLHFNADFLVDLKEHVDVLKG
jgi:DNA (cytosine-5)-methyltransferase 1